MKKISRFEELIAWQKAMILTKAVYQATKQGKFSKDFGLSTQTQRVAVFIMANIAEGFERNRLSEFRQYLSVAKSSCAELRSHLYVTLDAGYFDSQHFTDLQAQAEEVARILGGIRQSVVKQQRSIKSPNRSTQGSGLSTQDLPNGFTQASALRTQD